MIYQDTQGPGPRPPIDRVRHIHKIHHEFKAAVGLGMNYGWMATTDGWNDDFPLPFTLPGTNMESNFLYTVCSFLFLVVRPGAISQ